jgi:predicted RNase H-like HicB family nuclease
MYVDKRQKSGHIRHNDIQALMTKMHTRIFMPDYFIELLRSISRSCMVVITQHTIQSGGMGIACSIQLMRFKEPPEGIGESLSWEIPFAIERNNLHKYHLTVTIWEEDGVYVSKCVELEVASCGDTPKEARENIREAIDLYLKNAVEYGMLTDLEPSLTAQEKFTSLIEVQA